jgi:hypothetical protein
MESAIFQPVAQFLNKLRHRVPQLAIIVTQNLDSGTKV